MLFFLSRGKFYGILASMHKDFYASGFIYHPPSGQILLQQQKTASKTPSIWSLIGGECLDKNCGKATFREILNKLLDLKLNLKEIYPIYSYSSRGNYKKQHILFAQIKTKKNFSPKKTFVFSWFTLKQILKLPLTEQAKHDIIIGQRVIDAIYRKSLGQ